MATKQRAAFGETGVLMRASNFCSGNCAQGRRCTCAQAAPTIDQLRTEADIEAGLELSSMCKAVWRHPLARVAIVMLLAVAAAGFQQ